MARRRHLPDLPALVRRLRRRRRRGPARHHRPAAPPGRPGCRRRVAVALLHLAAGRRRLRRRGLPRRRPAVRHPGRRRPRCSRRPTAGAAGHRRPGPEPHLRRARLVPGRAGRRAGQPGAGPLPLPRRSRGPARGRAAEQLGERVRRPGLDPGHRARRHPRPVVPAPVRRQAARPRLDQPRGRRRVPVTSCGSGSTAGSTASASTWPTGWSRPTACPTGTATARARRAAHVGAAHVGPARRARDLPALAPGRSTSTPATTPMLRAPRPGCGPPTRWPATSGPTRCTRRSTSTSS